METLSVVANRYCVQNHTEQLPYMIYPLGIMKVRLKKVNQQFKTDGKNAIFTISLIEALKNFEDIQNKNLCELNQIQYYFESFCDR